MNSLPKGNSALLMTDEEFEETLQRGKRTKENGPKREIPKKIRKSASQNATKASSEYTKLAKQEEEQLDTATEASNDAEVRAIWDNPVPKPEVEWMYDPRMPDEWNAVIAAIVEQRKGSMNPKGEIYRDALPDEISEPSEFNYSQNGQLAGKKSKRPLFRLPVEDTSKRRLDKLRQDLNHPTRPKERLVAMRDTQPHNVAKGGKVANNLTEADYPRLRQQWHDEFVDMVEGTKPVLPPWREVNHEINLIDENKRYTYHMPRCPNSLRDEFHEKINRYVDMKWWEP